MVTASCDYVAKADSSSKIFQPTKYLFFHFFAAAPNDRGYGHGRFAGVFAVAQRQSECGRKTRKVHVSQPVNIGVCYAVVVLSFNCLIFSR